MARSSCLLCCVALCLCPHTLTQTPQAKIILRLERSLKAKDRIKYPDNQIVTVVDDSAMEVIHQELKEAYEILNSEKEASKIRSIIGSARDVVNHEAARAEAQNTATATPPADPEKPTVVLTSPTVVQSWTGEGT